LPDPTILSALFVDWGVSADSTVVVYDDLAGAVASRLWWLMRWMGHERVSLLDGGLQAWTGAGLALSVDAPADRCGMFEGRPGSMPVIDVEAVLSGLDNQSLILLDARDPDRFLGRSEPIDAVAGHIPGAQNASFKNNIGADRRFRDADTLREYYLPLKGEVISMSDVACMCGSGVTACHTLLALEQAGLSGAALYVGSWSDWISDPQRPVARDDA
jgi:thiosulfate/3-mercaptopyruvate sulfurtransferase